MGFLSRLKAERDDLKSDLDNLTEYLCSPSFGVMVGQYKQLSIQLHEQMTAQLLTLNKQILLLEAMNKLTLDQVGFLLSLVAEERLRCERAFLLSDAGQLTARDYEQQENYISELDRLSSVLSLNSSNMALGVQL